MRAYMEYNLECLRKGYVPMPKQDWMQLGMPSSPTDTAHVNWLKIEEPKRFEERAAMFERIKKS